MIQWFIDRVTRRQPDFIIVGGRTPDDPAVLRWWIIPRNRFFNIYLHKFLRDDAQDLHDHPWPNCSIPLTEGYTEQVFSRQPIEGEPLPTTEFHERVVMRPTFRRASQPHQVIVHRRLTLGIHDEMIPCFSLFFTGPKIREWGFWCPGDGRARWKHYLKYTNPANYGITGQGCEETDTREG